MKSLWSKYGERVITLVLVILVATGVTLVVSNQTVQQGVTNFDSLTLGGTLSADTIAETTSGSGVTIDGLTIQDGSLGGAVSISGAITPTQVVIDGNSDQIALRVQGYTTQTSNLLTLEQSDGTDVTTVSNAGAMTLASTLDVVGSTEITGTLTTGGAITYGSNSMHPLGYVSSGKEIVCATTTITGENQSVSVTGITTVTHGFAWLITDPGSGAGDPYMVTTDTPAGNDANLVVNIWQDDANAATSGATIGYCAIGDE